MSGFLPGHDEYADMARRFAEVCAKHDPCTNCGHGRLLHKRQGYRDVVAKAKDDLLGETRCRQEVMVATLRMTCTCEKWEGEETPMPGWL